MSGAGTHHGTALGRAPPGLGWTPGGGMALPK